MLRPTASALLAASLCGCAADSPAPAEPVVQASPTPAASSVHRYDAAGLERALAGGGSGIERAGAAHDLAELLRFEETRALELDDAEAAVAARERRAAVARRGLAALEGASEREVELLYLRGELTAYLITDWRTGLVHGGSSREALRAALALDPRHAGARLAWAKQFHYLPPMFGGDPAECERLLRELLRDSPEYEPAWSFLGQVLQVAGKKEQAREALLRARELDPASPRAAWYLARGAQ